MKRLPAYFFAAFVLVSACSNRPTVPVTHSTLDTVAFTRWNKRTLNTCWEFVSGSTKDFRYDVEKLVGTAFEKTVVKFVGWQKCSSAISSDVKVFIYDDFGSLRDKEFQTYISSLVFDNGSRKEGAGHPRLRGLNRPMRLVLNQTFKDADPEFATLFGQLNPQGRKNIALTAAVHEFGHVIGLRHEDSHPERTCDQFAEDPVDIPGEFLVVSAYNPFSFMSRCYYRTFNYNLSYILPNAKDIEGINMLYAGVAE